MWERENEGLGTGTGPGLPSLSPTAKCGAGVEIYFNIYHHTGRRVLVSPHNQHDTAQKAPASWTLPPSAGRKGPGQS